MTLVKTRRLPALAARLALLAPLTLGSSPALAATSTSGGKTRAARVGAVLEDSQQRAGYTWQSAAVLHPIEVPPSGVPAELTRLPAPKPGVRSPQPQGVGVHGAVEVGPRTAAMVRLEALGVARVRLVGGARERLRFHRVSGEGGTAWAAALEGPIELTPGTWLLEQPPGGPSYWLVTAPRAAEVVIETVAPRTGDLIWEHAIGAVLAWIEDGGDTPPLPAVVGAEETRRELEADAQIATEIERLDPRDPSLRRAVVAWRQASAIQMIEALRRPIRPAFALELAYRALAGATWLKGQAGWQRVRGPQTAVWTLTGPGVLWVEARSVGVAGEGSITVHAAGRRLGHAALLRPIAEQQEDVPEDLAPRTGEKTGDARSGEPKPEAPASLGGGRNSEDTDLGAGAADGAGPDERIGPRLAAVVGAPVGPRGALRIPLAPGKHDYTIELDSADAVALLRVGRRNERLAGVLRGEGVTGVMRRGHRALAESTSPRASLVRALYAVLEAAPAPALEDRDDGPVLALTRTWLRAQAHGLGGKQRIALAREVANQVAKRDADPMIWRARRTALELLEGTGEAGLARVLVGPRASEAPTELLERLARQIGGSALAVRSPAVALFELARRRAPLDPRLRAAYRDQWRAGTRWATLRADEAAGAPWTWIEPWTPSDDRTPGTRALWRWPNGEARSLKATVSGATPGRSALLRMYVQLPAPLADDPLAHRNVVDRDLLRGAALSMVVGERTWHGVALSSLESWRVALPPGEHSVRMTAPEGATLWSSQPSTTGGPPEGHLLRMWPAVAGAQMRFLLPAGLEPGFVRIEARAVADREGPQRARVYIARDDGPERAVDLWLPPADPAIVPMDAAVGVGPRASVVVGIGPDTRAVWVRVADNAPRLALAASIRSTRDTDLAATGRAEDAALLAAALPAPGDESPLDRLVRLSRAIHEKPEDLGLRLARAELLLDLDQPGYAFVDWRMVTAGRLSGALAASAIALAERLDALDAPDSLDLTTDVPVLVAPALAAAIGPAETRLQRIAPAIAAARKGGPSAGLRALDRLGLDDETRWRAVGEPGRGGALPEDGPKDRSSGTAAPGPKDRSSGTAAPGPKDRSPGTGASTPGVATTIPGAEEPAPMVAERPDPQRVSEPVGDLIAAAVLRATWLDAQARPAEAARLWARLEARTGLWQAGLNGVRSFLNVLDVETPAGVMPPPPQAEGSALAYGLALSLRRTIRTPAIQRLATVAATRSRWSRVEGSERDAGHERLKVPRAPALPSPNAAVRQALVVPPWDPVDATLLRPGYSTVLELKRAAPGALGVDLWCQTVRPDLGEGGLPRVRIVLDGATLFDEPIVVEKTSGTTVEALPEGPHRLEVALDPASRSQLCSVRLRDDLGTLGSLRPTRWRVARAREPAEVVVLGPTTLAVEARGLVSGGMGPGAVQVSVAQGEGPFAPRGVVALIPEVDPRATPEAGRTISAGPARTEVISLPEPGPQRVLLRPDSGAVLVRLQQRLDAEPTPVPRPPIRALDLGGLVDPISPVGLPRTDVPPVASPPAPQRFGTVWSEVRGGRDDIEDNDDLAPQSQVRMRVGYARELLARRMWLGVAPELRWRDSTSLAGGGAVALQTVFPTAGLRTRLSAATLAQGYAGGPAWMAEGALYVDRLTWIAPRWQVVPSVDLRYRYQSLSPTEVVTAAEPVNPRIFTQYTADHPFALRPGVELRYQPLQDLRMFVAADIVPNSDFRGLDQANFRGGLIGVMALLRRIVPEFALAYEGSLRLKDADRNATFLQNRMHAGLGLGVWAGQAARIVFGVGDTLYVSAPYPIRNVVEAWLRIDLVFGRALRDYGPLDMSFRPVREHRLWTGEGGAR